MTNAKEATAYMIEKYGSWKKLAQDSDQIHELTSCQRNQVKEALAFLGEEFPSGFMKTAIDQRHPIAILATESVAYRRKWFIYLSEALKELKKQQGYKRLLQKLISGNDFAEALSIIEVAVKFCKNGFDVYIEPPSDITGSPKKPDLMLIAHDTGERILVEVSVLLREQSQREGSETFYAVIERFSRSFYHPTGFLLRSLSGNELESLLGQVDGMVREADSEHTMQVLVKKSVIEVAICRSRDNGELRKWALERGLEVEEFRGPASKRKTSPRLKNKISTKVKQLSSEMPSILVLWHDELFVHNVNLTRLATELSTHISNIPNLLFCAIVGQFLGGEESKTELGGNLLLKRVFCNIIQENCLLVRNEKVMVVPLPKVQKRLVQAFETPWFQTV